MKYAIIYENKQGRKYLTGFTNEVWMSDVITRSGRHYCIELIELSSLFIPLEGDAAIHLS